MSAHAIRYVSTMHKKRQHQKRFNPKPALREYREKNGLSCDEAGAKIGVKGVTWRSYENGNREVDGDMAKAIEEQCGVERAKIRPDLFERAAA